MENNGERMATDSASLRHSSREGSDQLPTAPRRNSTEDEDISRPRKRLATMGSGPQSPQIMDTDEMRSANLQQNIEEEEVQMNYSPNGIEESVDGTSTSKSGTKGSKINTSGSQTPIDETDTLSENSLEDVDITAKIVEPSDPSRSPLVWQEETQSERKSPELVHPTDELEELDQAHDGAVDVDLIVDEPHNVKSDPRQATAIMERVTNQLSREDSPIMVLHEFRNQISACIDMVCTEDVDSFQRTYQSNRAFWDCLPSVVDYFLKRSESFSNTFYRRNPDIGMTGPDTTIGFLSKFAHLTSELILKDLEFIRRYPNQEQINLLSDRYVQSVGLSFRWETPLFNVFKKDRVYNFSGGRLTTAVRFCHGTGGIKAIREITEILFERIPKQQNLLPVLINFLGAAQQCLTLCRRIKETESDMDENQSANNPLTEILLDSRALFISFERRFRRLIESNHSIITIKELVWSYDAMGTLAYDLGTYDFRGVVSQLGMQEPPNDLTSVEQPLFVEWCWKFPLCFALINTVKLDLRIYGIQRLSDGILRIWLEMTRNGLRDSTLLRCVANSLQSNKVVEYFVGAGSHTELTRRCSSILQFLIVSHQLTPAIREAVWRPLIENKDSRTVAATMSLIEDSIGNLPMELCVDYCKRASAIPVATFELATPAFIRKLVDASLQAHSKEEQGPPTDIPNPTSPLHVAVYDMLISFLNSAATAEEDGLGVKIPPYWVMGQIRDDLYRISQSGPSIVERQKIYEDCLVDIRSKSKTATASIMVIVAFLRPIVQQYENMPGISILGEHAEVKHLFVDLQLHVAVVEELRFFVDEHHDRHTDYVIDALRSRMDLIETIISVFPEGLTPDLSFVLWDCLMGSHAIGSNERMVAFNELANLAQITMAIPEKKSKMKPFFQTMFTEYFPRLPPAQFSEAALQFCCRALEYINEDPKPDSDGIVHVKGIDQIWRIILSSPPHMARISHEAMNYMVKYYFDSLVNQDSKVLQDTHFALVTSCISHLKSTTSTLESSQTAANTGMEMAVDLTEEETVRTHLEFQRSVELLSALIKGYRIRPHCTNPLSSGDRGDPIKIRCQIMGTPIPKSEVVIECWSNETAGSLTERISRISGASNFRVLYMGKELHLKDEPERKLKDLRFSGFVSLMVMARPDSKSSTPVTPMNTALELEVLKHFDEFYGLLVLPEPYGAMIWKLLREFPIQKQISGFFEADTINTEQWPTGHPWQIQYFIAAMKDRMAQFKNSVDIETRTKFYHEAIVLLLLGLSDVAISGPGSTHGIRAELTTDYLQTLLSLLKNQTVSVGILGEVTRPHEPIESLLAILKESLLPESEEDTNIASLSIIAFDLIFTLTDRCQLWEQLINVQKLSGVVGTAVIRHSYDLVRRSTSDIILKFCRGAPDSSISHTRTIFFWDIIHNKLLSRAKDLPGQAGELLQLANDIFQYLALKYPESVDVSRYFKEWSNEIMEYKFEEPLSTVFEDYFFAGCVQLTQHCLMLASDTGQELDTTDLVHTVFWKFLFTPYSGETELASIGQRFPVISTLARGELYRLLLTSATYFTGYGELLDLLLELFPADDYMVDGWNVDRSRWLVSPSGYLGMRNLSNTCYLNSLMTQLFMNTQFRGFIFEVEIEDHEKQNLLSALKGLFAQMQGGQGKFVDPSPITQAIRDQNDEEIDVSVQMDVDEFFNLLFDRLEGQMPNKEVKEMFRGLYGGHLIQQIKSKECEHISERDEPFSAIQCDIKGKANLVESLQAYVEGDIMEGDNKYSCSTCNKHVDAVKRVCLKDIPDHLIFHLKRFEFDLETLTRRKINDRFDFPEVIDMRPYTVQYLSDPESAMTPDAFELVGVLVHAGNAESGHYYSYVKNGDSDPRREHQHWLHFNDSEVTDFEYGALGDCCFGGTNGLGEMGNHTITPKPYSAYMLFYKRVDAPGAVPMSRSSIDNIPEDFRTEILQENESTVRRYCMFDNEFISFVLAVTQRAHDDENAEEDHRVATKATQLMLSTICNITSRIKDCTLGDTLVDKLRAIIATCVPCSREILDWACEDEFNIRLLIIKCPLMKVRGIFAQLIFDGLQSLASNKDCYEDLYGVSEEPHNPREYNDFFEAQGYIQKLFEILSQTMKLLQSSVRPWDEFFGILMEITTCGTPGIALFLQHNMLYRCLEFFYGEYPLRGNNSQFRTPERNRKPSYVNLLRILAHVIENLDFTRLCKMDEDEWHRHPAIIDGQARFTVTLEEKKSMFQRDKKDENIVYKFLYKQLELNGIHIDSTKRILTNWLTRCRFPDVQRKIRETLLGGISLDPASEAGPFLECLVVYVRFSEELMDVAEIIERVAGEVSTIQNSGGREHLNFFRDLRLIQNDTLPGRAINNKVVETVPQWAPALLTFCDPDVRIDTYRLVDECLFLERENATSEEELARLTRIVDILCQECFSFVEGRYFKNKELSSNTDSKSLDCIIQILTLCKNPDNNREHAERIDEMRAKLAKILEEEVEYASEGTDDNWNVSDFSIPDDESV